MKKMFYLYELHWIVFAIALALILWLAPKVKGADFEEKKDHTLAEKMIEWPPDKVFFQIIELSDEALRHIKIKVSDYREFLIEECAKKSAKSKITEKEFEGYKVKISKCSDTENLLIFILNLRKYQGNEGELAFEGSVF